MYKHSRKAHPRRLPVFISRIVRSVHRGYELYQLLYIHSFDDIFSIRFLIILKTTGLIQSQSAC